jgi:hypothetical protein
MRRRRYHRLGQVEDRGGAARSGRSSGGVGRRQTRLVWRRYSAWRGMCLSVIPRVAHRGRKSIGGLLKSRRLGRALHRFVRIVLGDDTANRGEYFLHGRFLGLCRLRHRAPPSAHMFVRAAWRETLAALRTRRITRRATAQRCRQHYDCASRWCCRHSRNPTPKGPTGSAICRPGPERRSRRRGPAGSAPADRRSSRSAPIAALTVRRPRPAKYKKQRRDRVARSPERHAH